MLEANTELVQGVLPGFEAPKENKYAIRIINEGNVAYYPFTNLTKELLPEIRPTFEVSENNYEVRIVPHEEMLNFRQMMEQEESLARRIHQWD